MGQRMNVVRCGVNQLRPHPSYVRHNLSGSAVDWQLQKIKENSHFATRSSSQENLSSSMDIRDGSWRSARATHQPFSPRAVLVQ